LNLLLLFGCCINNRGDYIFVDANTPQEITLRENAANEFRQFYDELKKVKNGSVTVVEYFLNVSFLKSIQINILIIFVDSSIQIMVLVIHNLLYKQRQLIFRYFNIYTANCRVLFTLLCESSYGELFIKARDVKEISLFLMFICSMLDSTFMPLSIINSVV
jgi:hypothetical protein